MGGPRIGGFFRGSLLPLPYAPCMVYLPTKLGDFGQGQMLGFIFQHHGSHMGYQSLPDGLGGIFP